MCSAVGLRVKNVSPPPPERKGGNTKVFREAFKVSRLALLLPSRGNVPMHKTTH